MFTRSVSKLRSKDASARLNLLRVLRTICDATEEQCTLLKQFEVYDSILYLSEREPAILARKMAEELIRDCDEFQLRGSSRGSALRRPPSSAGRNGSGSSSTSFSHATGLAAMTPPTPTLMQSFSMPPTPKHRERVGRSQSTANIYDMESARHSHTHLNPQLDSTKLSSPVLVRAQTTMSSSLRVADHREYHRSPSYRPPSRDSSGGTTASLTSTSNSSGGSSLGKSSASAHGNSASSTPTAANGKSRLPKARAPRTSLAAVGMGMARRSERSSMSKVRDQEENTTPTPTPPLPKLAIRRRRDTSGGEMSVGGLSGRARRSAS